MIILSRKLSTIPDSKFIHFQRNNSALIPLYLPFSQLQQQQQRKLLESRIVSILHGCTSVVQIKQVHAHLLSHGLDQCCYVLTKLIRTFSNLGVPMDSYPRSVFQQVNYPNPFLWTAMIRGYAVQGPFSESIRLYNNMRKQGTSPTSFTFSALFKASGSVLNGELGRQIHAQTILVGGFASDLYVGNTMIDMYVKCGFLECGRKVFDEMPERDIISWTELIVAYSKNGKVESALELFVGLPVKDMVAWTAMVTGYAQNGRPREAIDFFIKMQDEGVETDEVTLVGVISACAQLGTSKYATWVRDIAEKSGFHPSENVVIGSALIDMYSKCGSVEEAFQVFEGIKEKNVYSYSSMIVGYAVHGRPHLALQLFHEMLKTEIKPNKVTFVGVLTACSHAGLVEQGRQLFSKMEKFFGVSPSADHYACMVDLLGRAGRLEEAIELVESMPVEPHGGVWGAVLGACRIHGNPEIAQVAANHLFEIEPNGLGNYILLSHIYSSAGRWEEVAKVRKLMREKGLKKNPGCSWVEGERGELHEFVAGDLTHPKSSEIKRALEDLLRRLKDDGYKPNLHCIVYDVGDDEKKRLLMSHSEKLALAYGLLTTAPGCSIKIMKNLRICEDCHAVMRGASLLTGREIIVRDNTRFHHFVKGACSCGDFW